MEDSNSAQKSTEPFARRAEQEARRDAIAKARVQAEVDSIEEKTMRLRALRMAQASLKPDRGGAETAAT
jgi:hypothetical protein